MQLNNGARSVHAWDRGETQQYVYAKPRGGGEANPVQTLVNWDLRYQDPVHIYLVISGQQLARNPRKTLAVFLR